MSLVLGVATFHWSGWADCVRSWNEKAMWWRPLKIVEGLRVVRTGLAANDVIVINGLQHVAPGIQVQAKHVQMDASNAAVEQVAVTPTAAAPSVANPTAVARALSARATAR